MNGNIYITGFMGVGKSTIARALSRLLKRGLIDMDEAISKKSGLSVSSYFEKFGETGFREVENELLRNVASQERLVVSTGGGVPVNPQNLALMRNSGTIIHLDMPISECLARLGSHSNLSRPKWTNRASVESLYNERAASYKECDHRINVSRMLPDDCAWEICERLHASESTDVRMGPASHPLYISWKAPEELQALTLDRKVFVVTDRKVKRLHMDRYVPYLGTATVVALPGGERSKSLNNARFLYESMLKERIGRDDILIALGGGVITDLCAFVASTYKRGIDFALASTSLVGCVDAAIGGKAAVDLGRVKNPVGCFSSPSAVALDLRALSTLPLTCRTEGLVEAYKTGMIANPDLLSLFENDLESLLSGDLILLAKLVRLSAMTKVEIVTKDFGEKGLRRILNFGHTYGHAVEGFNHYRISHGVAVAVGMMVAINLSVSRAMIDVETSSRAEIVLKRFINQKVELPETETAWDIMTNDKKNRNGRIGFILLEGPFSPVFVEDVHRDELSRAIISVRGSLNG